MERRRGPVLVAVAVAVVVLWPAVGPTESDSFPLSTYPMFARDRGDNARVDTVVARRPSGERERLSPELIAGTDEPIQAAATVSRAISAGESPALCAAVGARLEPDDREALVEVVTERHDLDRPDPEAPLSVVVHATCAVPAP